MHSKIIAILLMAGTGERFASALPKQFHRLGGKKIYLHALEALLASEKFSDIILVARKDKIDEILKETSCYTGAQIHCIEGGATRQESSYQGVLYCKKLQPEIVLIHDAVRPFLSKKIIEENIEAAHLIGAADTCIPSCDTLVHAPYEDLIAAIPIRKEWLRGQTPQTFQFPILLQAHARYQGSDATDDCSLALRLGQKIKVVPGSERNIKITTDLDLILAEQLLYSSFSSKQGALRSLQGQKIAVTGGSGGIGKEICYLLQQEGATPIILSPSAPLYPVDLTSPENVKTIFCKIQEEQGTLDGLINSIGYLKRGSLASLTPQEIEKQLLSNLLAVIYSCKYAPLKTGSHIINIASSSYLQGKQDSTIYASAKAALVNFSQGLAQERQELYINVIAPERTHTPLRTQNFPGELLHTLLDPHTVAKEVIALLKTSVTGTLIPVRWKEKQQAITI